MKKIVSILLTLAFLATTFTAFAAITPTVASKSYSAICTDTFDSYGDDASNASDAATKLPTDIFKTTNSNQLPSLAIVNEALVIKQSAASTRGQIYYNFTGTVEADAFAFGFDIKFDNLTSIAENDYGSSTVFGLSPACSWYDSKDTNRTTAERFYASGETKHTFEFAKDEDSGVVTVTFGDAVLSQGAFYTVACEVDQVNKKYVFTVTDSAGNKQDAASGNVNPYFDDLGELRCYIELLVNNETTVTVDNFYAKINTGKVIINGDSLVVGNDGKVSLSAIIPESWTNPALYINNVKVDDITTTAGEDSYDITTALPAGVAFGDAKVEIRATKGGSAVSVSEDTTIVKEAKSEITYTKLNQTPTVENGEDVYAAKDTRTSALNPATNVDGLYEISLQFRPVESSNGRIDIRLRSNTANSTGWGTVCDHSGSAWNNFPYSYMSNCNLVYGDWNTAVWRFDFRGNAKENALPYSLYVNGVLAKKGTHMLPSSSTINGFIEVGINCSEFKNLKIYEIIGEPKAEETKVVYSDGSTEVYKSDAVTSVNLDKIAITLDQAVANTTDNVSFVDETGAAVANATVSVSDKVFTVDYSGTDFLQTGTYYLVIGKAATLNGVALGADIKVPVELSAADKLISPKEGNSYSDKVTLSVYSSTADKVAFYVNDVKVKDFAATNNGVYTYEYTPDSIGSKTFDAYIFDNNAVSVFSSDFEVVEDIKVKNQSNDFETSKGSNGGYTNIKTGEEVKATDGGVLTPSAGKDGTQAMVVTSNIGNGSTNTSNSGLGFALPSATTYRTMVTEFDIKLDANTYAYLELGANQLGNASTSGGEGYKTVYISGTSSSNPLFGSNGKIAGSDTTWSAGTWYTVKHVIDYPNMKNIIYINGNEVVNETITDSNISSYAATAVSYSKYKLMFMPVDDTKVADEPARVTVDNFKRYEPSTLPAVSSIKVGDTALTGNVISAGTDAVAIALDKAYDSDELNPFTSELIEVKANGEVLTSATVTVTDGANFAVSGLAGLKAGTVVDITVSDLARFDGQLTLVPLAIQLYVGDADKTAVLPIKIETNNSGTDLLAYTKYIGGDAEVKSYLIITEYDAESKKVKQAEFTPVTIGANESGAVSSYLTVDATSGCKVRLWNYDLAPLTTTGEVEAE